MGVVDKVIDELDDFLERMDLADILPEFVEAMSQGDVHKAAEIIAEFTNGNIEGENAKYLAWEIWETFGDELREMYG